MTQKIKIGIVLLAVCAVAAVGFFAWPAKALSGPLRNLDSFVVTCGTSPTLIQGDGTSGNTRSRGGAYFSLYCQNMTSTPVAFGDSGITTTTGPTVCNDAACARPDIPMDASRLYCIAGSDTVLQCLSGS